VKSILKKVGWGLKNHLVMLYENVNMQQLYIQFLHTFTSLSDVKFPSALNILGMAAANVSRTGSSVRRAMWIIHGIKFITYGLPFCGLQQYIHCTHWIQNFSAYQKEYHALHNIQVSKIQCITQGISRSEQYTHAPNSVHAQHTHVQHQYKTEGIPSAAQHTSF